MKKLLVLIISLVLGSAVFADDRQNAVNFFSSFVSASNNYNPSLLNMYSDDARIIRQVIKPNGELVNAYFTAAQYRSQMKISSKIAKLRNYKNCYSDMKVSKVSDGYKIESLRRPCSDTYKLKTYMIIEKQPNGKWLITEEMMQTKEQIFLKYAK